MPPELPEKDQNLGSRGGTTANIGKIAALKN
jgi:hypothetical protein